MTESGKRLLDFLPPKINREGEIIGSLIANEDGNAALENLFTYSDTVRENYSGADNVYTMDSDLMDQTMKVFSHFERFYNESDASFVKRNKSIFVRGGDVTFGTTWNVKHVFEYYFPKAKIFLLDNIGKWEDNILINSNFESIVPSEIAKWTLSGCIIDRTGAFTGGKGVYFSTKNGTVSQAAAVTKGKTYFVTFAASGNISLTVKGASSDTKKLYSIGEVISGGSGQARAVDTDNWKFIQYFFQADKTENVTITVKGTSVGSKVDLITLDEKTSYPRFVVYAWFDQVTLGGSTLHLSKNGNDPVSGVDYDKESYFEHSFFTGNAGNTFAADMYKDILNFVKSAGTKAEIVLLTKET